MSLGLLTMSGRELARDEDKLPTLTLRERRMLKTSIERRGAVG